MITRPNEDEIIPRYEFRTFDRDLADVAERIGRLAACSAIKKSSEMYLVTKTKVSNSVKIRDETLEMKSLLETRGPLELWKPRFKLALPLRPGIIKSQVFAPLAADPAKLEAGTMIDKRMLVEQIIPSCSDIRLARVGKQRFLFEINLCRVEYGELFIEDRPMQTVAIEHEEAGKVLRLREILGLALTENTSYMKKLEQIMDHSRSPVD